MKRQVKLGPISVHAPQFARAVPPEDLATYFVPDAVVVVGILVAGGGGHLVHAVLGVVGV